MKISAIDAYPVSLPVRGETTMVTSLGEHNVSNYVLTRVHTDEGLVGFGEATVAPTWSGETQEGTLTAVRQVLSPVLVGLDPLDTGSLRQAMDRVLVGNPFTKASVEMAVLDLAGKILHAPAHALLGGRKRDPEIYMKFSIGSLPPSSAARIAESAALRGLRSVKVKVGLDPVADISRVQAVRSALGDDFRIGVDANGGWSRTEALAMLPHLERLGVNVIEQPLCRGDFRGCAELRRHTEIPLLLDESIFTAQDALEAIRHEACDLISIYPGKNGGLWKSLEVAHVAAAANIECVIGSNLEWEIGSAAMLHLAVCIPRLAALVDHDIIGPLYYAQGVTREAIRIHKGCAVLPNGPGLGIELDFDLIGRIKK